MSGSISLSTSEDPVRASRCRSRRRGAPAAPICPPWWWGAIIEPRQAEAILADGDADLVALGRQAIAEPHWLYRAAQRAESRRSRGRPAELFASISSAARPCSSLTAGPSSCGHQSPHIAGAVDVERGTGEMPAAAGGEEGHQLADRSGGTHSPMARPAVTAARRPGSRRSSPTPGSHHAGRDDIGQDVFFGIGPRDGLGRGLDGGLGGGIGYGDRDWSTALGVPAGMVMMVPPPAWR